MANVLRRAVVVFGGLAGFALSVEAWYYGGEWAIGWLDRQYPTAAEMPGPGREVMIALVVWMLVFFPFVLLGIITGTVVACRATRSWADPTAADQH
jgi:hypothetical protein